jgi:hypothetical protein
MALKWASKRHYDAITKAQKQQANLKRHVAFQRVRDEVRAVKEEAARINEVRRMKEELRAARTAASQSE